MLRAESNGVRGYPFLEGVPVRLQAPVLHCTGNLAKIFLLFILSHLNEIQMREARMHIYRICGRDNLQSLYLRDSRELFGMALAAPTILGGLKDGGFRLLLQLVQLLRAS